MRSKVEDRPRKTICEGKWGEERGVAQVSGVVQDCSEAESEAAAAAANAHRKVHELRKKTY